MDYLPIFIDVRDQSCLVFGGGESARGKIDLLLKSSAKVHVVARELCNAIAILKEKQFLSHQMELPQMSALKNYKLIFVATENEKVRESIVLDASLADSGSFFVYLYYSQLFSTASE